MSAIRVVVPLLAFTLIATNLPAGDPVKMRRARLGHRASQEPVTDDMRAAARSANAFAFDLYTELNGQDSDGNFFFSPAGLWSVLTVVSAGANGETESQLRDVLHVNLPQDRILTACGRLNPGSDASGDGVALNMANRIWTAWNRPPMRAYLTRVRKACDEWPVRIDFTNSRQAARAINRWVEQKTRGKITGLVSPGSLPSDTQILLTSASYFNAKWQSPFNEARTKEEPFQLVGGGQVPVRMMHQTFRFRYGESEGLQLVELPYAGGDYAMIILLPKNVGFDRLEPALTTEALETWLAEIEHRRVELSVPRFSTSARMQLAEVLGQMGMPLAFSGSADFSRMSPHRLFRITEVAHAGSITVNEKATEAATATKLLGGLGGGSEPQPPVEFRADRPFVFLIRDVRTGLILYLGRVMDPTQ